MGSAGFSLTASLADLLKQSVGGIVIGGAMGYLSALLIAHEKFDFLAKYAPVITLMAIIGTYLGADDTQTSGFMAVFVFGIILGNKESFGFRMNLREHKKLQEYVARTAMIMRMFIFILLGSQVDFSLMGKFPVRRGNYRNHIHADRKADYRYFMRPSGPASKMELQRNALYELDERDRRNPRSTRRFVDGKTRTKCRNHSCRYIYRYPYDYPNPGYYCEVAGRKIGIAGISIKAVVVWRML